MTAERKNTSYYFHFSPAPAEAKRMRTIFVGITLGLFFAFSFVYLYQAALVAIVFGLFAYYKWHQYYRWFISKLSFDSKNIYLEYTDKGKAASAVLARESSTVQLKRL